MMKKSHTYNKICKIRFSLRKKKTESSLNVCSSENGNRITTYADVTFTFFVRKYSNSIQFESNFVHKTIDHIAISVCCQSYLITCAHFHSIQWNALAQNRTSLKWKMAVWPVHESLCIIVNDLNWISMHPRLTQKM